MREGAVDLTDVELFTTRRHHEALARLRATDPVHWNPTPDGGFWALTRYEDVLAAYRDHASFGSTRGSVVGGSFGRDDDSAGGRMLVASDLPRHRLLKQEVHPALSQEVVAAVGAEAGAAVETALDRIAADGGGDVADLAAELPTAAPRVVFGVGRADARRLLDLTRRMIGYRGEAADAATARLVLARAQGEIFAYFASLVAARRRAPGEDLVSILLRAKINGRPLTEEDILYNCLNVAVGGNETTSHTAAAGVAALAEHPDQRDLLFRHPALVGSAIEEILRWSTVNAYVQRVVRRDVRIGRTALRAGDSVTLWNVSANRDETQFERASSFEIRRSPNRHLSLGAGLHRCLGAPAAQAELTPLFAGLARRNLRLKLAGPVRWMRSNFILGVLEMPVVVR